MPLKCAAGEFSVRVTARSSDDRRPIERRQRTRLHSRRPRAPPNYRPSPQVKPCCHLERLSLDLRMSGQRVLDLLLDVGYIDCLRLDRDAVANAGDTGQFPNGIPGRLLLILPIYLT